MIVYLEGKVVDIRTNEYEGKKGKVQEKILSVLNKGNGARPALVEISVPVDSIVEIGVEFASDVEVSFFGSGFLRTRAIVPVIVE